MAIGSAGMAISSSLKVITAIRTCQLNDNSCMRQENVDALPQHTDVREVKGECTTPVKRRKLVEDDVITRTECTTACTESTPNDECEYECLHKPFITLSRLKVHDYIIHVTVKNDWKSLIEQFI